MSLIALVGGGQALAVPPAGTCFAVSMSADGDQPPTSTRCAGSPKDYSGGRLWLRLPSPEVPADGGVAVVVNSTRFKRMVALFVFADGLIRTQVVDQGAFGSRWHIGGQIAFEGEARTARLVSVWLRIDHLQSYDLLRVRTEPVELARRQAEFRATLIGAALGLLMVAMLYTLGLAAVTRRALFLWHGTWAGLVLFWGLVWSQAVLTLFPALAGTLSSKIAAITSCLAIFFASLSAERALRRSLSRAIRVWIVAAAAAIVALGAWADLPGANLAALSDALAVLTLALLATIGSGLAIGWRRGESAARDLLIAWIIPMLVLGATQFVDFDTILFGGGAQIAVLFASAFQTFCLSTLATFRLGRLRIERDAAIAGRAVEAELAERDPLTGLLNRRGFVRRCEAAFGSLTMVPFGLLLIDIDRFKSINDQLGHEAGDAVLVGFGGRLRLLEQQQLCLAGRLGGEEFVIGISGMPVYALHEFAEYVRATLGSAHDGEPSCPSVTVSIGVAEGLADGPFDRLYGRADRALYAAKAGGRDRVVFQNERIATADQQFQLSLE